MEKVEPDPPTAKTMVITIMAKAPLNASNELIKADVDILVNFIKTASGFLDPIAFMIKEHRK